MGLSEREKLDLFRIVAAVLHLGNIDVNDYRDRAEIRDFAAVERVCHLLGVPAEEFKKALLSPRIKAGRDWVTQAKSPAQVVASIDALAKTLYERNFAHLVERINKAIDGQRSKDKLGFIGVLDIAGFEIFEVRERERERGSEKGSIQLDLDFKSVFLSQIALNNYVSTIPMKSYNNSLIKICLSWNKKNTRKKRLIGTILTLEMIFNLRLI